VDRRAADPGGGVEAVLRPTDPGGGMERAVDPDAGVEAAVSAAALVSRHQRERGQERDGRRRHTDRDAGGGNARWRPPPCGAMFLFFFLSQFSFFPLNFFPFQFLFLFSSHASAAFFT